MKPGQYIRKHRQAAEMSLRELADKLEVSHVFLGALERGVKPVPSRLIEPLAEAVPGIRATALRKSIQENSTLRLEVDATRGVDREIVTAFARKAESGFSKKELRTLRKLLWGGSNDDEP